MFVGLDIEPARLVTARLVIVRLVNELARFGSFYKRARIPARLGSLKSSSQLVWLASQTPKTHFRDILELELGSGAPLLYPIGGGGRKRRRAAPASRARRAVGEQRNRAEALLAADLLCRAGAAACTAQAEG